MRENLPEGVSLYTKFTNKSFVEVAKKWQLTLPNKFLFFFHIPSFVRAIGSSSLKNTLVADYDETLSPGFYGGNVTLTSMRTDRHRG